VQSILDMRGGGEKKKKHRSEVSSPVGMVINSSSKRWRRQVAYLGNMISAKKLTKITWKT